jgi:hypothetical protein
MQLTGHELILFIEALTACGIAVALLAKVLRWAFKGHLDEDIHKVVVFLSLVAGYAQYFDQIHTILPPYVLGVSVPAIYGVSQLAYKIAKATTALLNKTQAAADAPLSPTPPTDLNAISSTWTNSKIPEIASTEANF